MVADKADKGKKLKMADKVDEENAEQIDSALVLSIEKLQEVQDELEKINDEASEKILNLEQKYSKLRKPIYSKRDEIVQSIPDFWLTAFLSHPALSDCFTEDDHKILKYLTALEVDDSDDVKSGFSIHFNFKANPYFENTKISKVYTVLEDGTTKITATPIKWKEGMGISNGVTHEKEGNKRPHEDDSFFTWFVDSEHSEDMEGIADEIAEVIKEDLWPNPLCYFNNDSESEEDVSDAEGDEEFQMHQTLKGGLAGLGQKVRRRDRQNESPAVARPRGILQCSKCGGWGHNARTYGRVPARRMKAEERRAFEAAKAANPTTVNKTKKRVAGISQSQPPMATRRRTNTTAEGQSSSQPTQSATGATRRRANTAVEGQSSSQPGGSATGAAPSRRPNTRSGAAGQRSSTQP